MGNILDDFMRKPDTKKDLKELSDALGNVYGKLCEYKEELGYSPDDRQHLDLSIEYILVAYKNLEKHIDEEVRTDKDDESIWLYN